MATPLANSPLANPNAVLSGPSLVAAAHALANAQTSGAFTELMNQVAQNQSQTAGAVNQVGGFFNQLGQLAGQGSQQEQNIASALSQQLAGIGQSTQSQLGQIGSNAQAALSQYSPTSGTAGGNPGAQGLAAEMARQQGLAAQNQGALQAYGATQGANYSGLGASQLGDVGLRGQEDLTNIAQAGQVKNEPLVAKEANLTATNGADFATALGKLRQQEITNAISEQGLGIKQAAVNATVGDNVRTTGASIANNKRTTATSAANAALGAATSTANNKRTTQTSAANNAANNARAIAIANQKTGAGATKPLTPAQNNVQLTDLGKITTAIKTWNQANGGGIRNKAGQVIEPHPTDAQMATILGQTYNPVLVQAGIELHNWGYITPQTAQELHNSGIRGGTWNNAPIQVKNPPAATGVGTLNINPGAAIGGAVQGALGG